MTESAKKTIRSILKVLRTALITIGVIWLILLIVLQLVLSESFLRGAIDKYLPDFVEGADVRFTHIKANAIKSFPNLRISIDSLTVTYPHEMMAGYDSLPGIDNRLSAAGRGKLVDTLASFSYLSVSVSYIDFLKGKISFTDLSFKDPKIYLHQINKLKGNWSVLKFLQTTDTTSSGTPDLLFGRIGLKGRTSLVYTNPSDTVFASVRSRNIEFKGKFALQDPFRASVSLDIDSTFITGRTATDTIAAGLNTLRVRKLRRFHRITAEGRTFIAMGGSGQMMLPLFLDAQVGFPDKSPEKINVKGLHVSLASFGMGGNVDLEFPGDSIGVNGWLATDSCNVSSVMKDFAPLLGPEISAIGSDADVSLTLTCNGFFAANPLRLPENLTARLLIPESKLTHKALPEAGRLAADITASTDEDGRLSAVAQKLTLSLAGINVDGKAKVSDILGADPLIKIDAAASARLNRLSAFLPKGSNASGFVDSKLCGEARLSEFGPGRFAGANLDGFIATDSLTYRDESLTAFVGKTDIQLAKRPRGKRSKDIILMVEGQIDSIFASVGTDTRLRGKNINLSISDTDASIMAERLSMIGEDSLFMALRNSRNHLKINRSVSKDGSNTSSFALTSDNDRIFVRQGDLAVGLRNAQVQTSAQKRLRNNSAKRKKMLDSLQRIWPGVPRDSLFRKMLRSRREANKELDAIMAANDKFSSQDIHISLDESLKKYFREWALEGNLNIEKGFMATPAFPLRTRVSNLQGSFNNDQISIESMEVKSTHSNLSAKAVLSGIRKALLRSGTLSLDMSLSSDTLNANEILGAIDAGQRYAQAHPSPTAAALEHELSEEDTYAVDNLADTTATGVPLIVIPSNLDVNIGISGEKIIYSSLEVDSYSSRIVMKDRCLQITSTSATSNMGDISLACFYSTRSKEDINIGLDLKLKDITADKVVTLIPQVDTLLPLLKSFKGSLDCEFALTSDLDTNMNFIKNTVAGLMEINGRNLEIDQDKSIRKITKLLRFKNRKTGLVEEMSVRGILGNSTLEIFPFNLRVDRYKLALGGSQNFDGNFKYHISVLKSPIPFKWGINLSGNFDKWKWRLGGAKYKKIDTPVYTRQLDTARRNLVNSIMTIFDKGVSIAVEQNRRELSGIGADSTLIQAIGGTSLPEELDTLSASQLSQIDSLERYESLQENAENMEETENATVPENDKNIVEGEGDIEKFEEKKICTTFATPFGLRWWQLPKVTLGDGHVTAFRKELRVC